MSRLVVAAERATPRWVPTARSENRKLSSSLSSGSSSANLSRTRGKRPVDIIQETPVKIRKLFSTRSDSDNCPPNGQTPSRGIMEFEHLRDVFSNFHCPKCKRKLTVDFSSICLATSCSVACSDDKCDFEVSGGSLTTADNMVGTNKQKRSTDYATNVLYVLSFICSGDGGKEAARLLGALDLPNSASMEKTSFPTIHRKISPLLEGIADQACHEALLEEVRQVMLSQPEKYGPGHFERWLEALSDSTIDFPVSKWPILVGAYDMGWQKRSSGRDYASNSGHAVMVGMQSRRILCRIVMSKLCRICQTAETLSNKRKEEAVGEKEPKEHCCLRNYAGASGNMEPEALLRLLEQMYDGKKVVFGEIVTDDDSTMKAQCRWSNADWLMHNNRTELPLELSKYGNLNPRKNSGCLRYPIPEPAWLGDLAHRTKSYKGVLFSTEKKRAEDKKGLLKVDAYRLATNFAFLTRKLSTLGLPCDQWSSHAKAVVKHHFDDHTYCGSFCRRKKESIKQRKASGKFYRSKVHQPKLYKLCTDMTARFITEESLRQVCHGYDTQVNESFNNTVSWLAPKNKTYSFGHSLSNRISIGVSISLLGTEEFYARVFDKLGIQMTDGAKHHFQLAEKARQDSQIRGKSKVRKMARKELHRSRLKGYTEKAHKARLRTYKKEGIYDPGVQMPAPIIVETVAENQCMRCRLFGHKTANSKKCKFYKPRKKKNDSTIPVELDNEGLTDEQRKSLEILAKDAIEQEELDAVGFVAQDDLEDPEDIINEIEIRDNSSD